MDITEATTKITTKIGTFWTSRVQSMLVHGCISKKGAFPLDISELRVSKAWPRKGSITCTRGDGAKVRLYMTKRDGFKVRVTELHWLESSSDSA